MSEIKGRLYILDENGTPELIGETISEEDIIKEYEDMLEKGGV